MSEDNKVIIVCGATASGKSSFAHKIAMSKNGEIVNADSMQIYKQIPIITASPSDVLKNEIPYHLYNFQDADKEFSAAKYVQCASKIIKDISYSGKVPVIVGGSGMYINMLINGYSSIPEITDSIRAYARNLYQEIGLAKFIKQLKEIDPKISSTSHFTDPQRAIRAYEVKKQTGESIVSFQKKGNVKPLPEFDFEVILLMPERKFLYQMCNMRLSKLFANGAVEEIEALCKDYGYDLNTSAMKALGVLEIISYIKGNITLNEAISLASTRTRQYAKRQITWFNNQIKENKHIIEFSNAEEYSRVINKIK